MNSTADYQASLIFLEIISALPYQQDPAIAAVVWVGPANRFTNCVEMELQVMYIRTVMERRCFYTGHFNRLLDPSGSKHIQEERFVANEKQFHYHADALALRDAMTFSPDRAKYYAEHHVLFEILLCNKGEARSYLACSSLGTEKDQKVRS